MNKLTRLDMLAHLDKMLEDFNAAEKEDRDRIFQQHFTTSGLSEFHGCSYNDALSVLREWNRTKEKNPSKNWSNDYYTELLRAMRKQEE